MDLIYSFWKGGHNLEQSQDEKTPAVSSDSTIDGTIEIIEKPSEEAGSGQCELENTIKYKESLEETQAEEESSASNIPVTQKAMKSALSFGSFLYSMANKAGRQVSETAKQVKHTIEENTILSDFNKEQEMFVKSKSSAKESRCAPWVGCVDEPSAKQQILSLSSDKRNFVRNPPEAVQFEFNFGDMHPVAEAVLVEDKALQSMRFDLVPKLVNEETFWRNYFYRVSLIKQSIQLASHGQDTVCSSADASSNSSVDDTAKDDFKGEEEWEKELQKELQEYDVVVDSTEAPADWEKEIAEMLETENSATVTTQ